MRVYGGKVRVVFKNSWLIPAVLKQEILLIWSTQHLHGGHWGLNLNINGYLGAQVLLTQQGDCLVIANGFVLLCFAL